MILLTLISIPVCFILSRFMIFLSNKIGFVNFPNPIVETHNKATAYGGGVAIGLTILIFLAIEKMYNETTSNFILIVTAILLLGLLDDIFRLSPLKKLSIQFVITILILLLFIKVSIPMIFLFIFIILIFQNAWNLIDIMDGLTAGISFVVFLSIGIILFPYNEYQFYDFLALIIAFSVLGFRFLNKNPAKIFLGETGTLLLGSLFIIVVINVFLISKITAIFLLFLAIIPFFELVFLIIVRTRKGIPFWLGSTDHFALRMLNNGNNINSINTKVILFNICYSLVIVLVNVYLNNLIGVIICSVISLIIMAIAFIYFSSLPAREIIQSK